ncbi:DUF2277 family protein [Arsenicicoccus dermatophilus]|uniref:DUF2277 family protein n=1 Tax=Arsenicicoccus dermatophilus TaxID=1076331 RepID=UPI003917160D
MRRSGRAVPGTDQSATSADARAVALQYVRRLTGRAKPRQGDEEACSRAVEDIALATATLLDSMGSTPTPAGPGGRPCEIVQLRRTAG